MILAPSPAADATYDLMYYLKGAAAGGICCSITHGALTPVDVVKVSSLAWFSLVWWLKVGHGHNGVALRHCR